jgi:uncharacterized membrane protein YesL
MGRFAVWYEHVCRIIMNVFVVHIAFLVHTLMGVVVVGFFPAIAATNVTYRTWLRDVKDREWRVKQTWMVFHNAWKQDLKGANLFGYPQFLLWSFLMWDYYIANNNYMGQVGIGVSGVLLLLNVLYGLFVFLSWIVRANFDEKTGWIIRYSLSMVVARPLCSFMLLILTGLVMWAYVKWPGLAIAFGVAIPTFAAVMTVYSFGKLPGMDVHVLEPQEPRGTRKNKSKGENKNKAKNKAKK